MRTGERRVVSGVDQTCIARTVHLTFCFQMATGSRSMYFTNHPFSVWSTSQIPLGEEEEEEEEIVYINVGM